MKNQRIDSHYYHWRQRLRRRLGSRGLLLPWWCLCRTAYTLL